MNEFRQMTKGAEAPREFRTPRGVPRACLKFLAPAATSHTAVFPACFGLAVFISFLSLAPIKKYVK
jgi:hypothetical protein